MGLTVAKKAVSKRTEQVTSRRTDDESVTSSLSRPSLPISAHHL